jgi:dolichol-phosphate mannosyltransferase
MTREKKAIIVIPTYNEKDNIQELLPRILQSKTAEHLLILVVDDDSPDGTGDAVAYLAQQEKRIHLWSAKAKEGGGAQGLKDSRRL